MPHRDGHDGRRLGSAGRPHGSRIITSASSRHVLLRGMRRRRRKTLARGWLRKLQVTHGDVLELPIAGQVSALHAVQAALGQESASALRQRPPLQKQTLRRPRTPKANAAAVRPYASSRTHQLLFAAASFRASLAKRTGSSPPLLVTPRVRISRLPCLTPRLRLPPGCASWAVAVTSRRLQQLERASRQAGAAAAELLGGDAGPPSDDELPAPATAELEEGQQDSCSACEGGAAARDDGEDGGDDVDTAEPPPPRRMLRMFDAHLRDNPLPTPHFNYAAPPSDAADGFDDPFDGFDGHVSSSSSGSPAGASPRGSGGDTADSVDTTAAAAAAAAAAGPRVLRRLDNNHRIGAAMAATGLLPEFVDTCDAATQASEGLEELLQGLPRLPSAGPPPSATASTRGGTAGSSGGTLLARFERIWAALGTPLDQRLDMVAKYTDVRCRLSVAGALNVWECAAAAVLALDGLLHCVRRDELRRDTLQRLRGRGLAPQALLAAPAADDASCAASCDADAAGSSEPADGDAWRGAREQGQDEDDEGESAAPQRYRDPVAVALERVEYLAHVLRALFGDALTFRGVPYPP